MGILSEVASNYGRTFGPPGNKQSCASFASVAR